MEDFPRVPSSAAKDGEEEDEDEDEEEEDEEDEEDSNSGDRSHSSEKRSRSMGWAPSWPHFSGVAVSFFDEWLEALTVSRTVVKMRRFRFSTSFPSCMIRCSHGCRMESPRRSVASSTA